GELKDLIKTKKSPRFNDVASDELTLWRVSIPVADDNNDDNDDDNDDDDDLPILLTDIPKNDKKKLKAAMQKVSEVFGYGPDEMIHVPSKR
ncbi:hypothetical protein BGZ54_005466, partial [Gamsiella multidivaricata]